MEFATKHSRVTLKPYVPRALKEYIYMSIEELIAGAGSTLIVDTEIYINYFLIAFKCMKTKKVFTLETSPDTFFNNRLLSWILHNYTTIGFNSFNFDIPLMWLAYERQHIETLKAATNSIIFSGTKRHQLQKEYDFKIYTTPHIDLMEVCPLKGGLKTYGARLHTSRIQDLPFDPNEALTKEKAEIVKQYCFNDLDNTETIAIELSQELLLRFDLSKTYKTDLMSKSNAQLSEAIISAELQKLTGKRPAKPKHIESGSHKYAVPHFIRFQTLKLQEVLTMISLATFNMSEFGMEVPAGLKDLKIQLGTSTYRMGNGGLHSCEKNVSYVADNEYGLYDRDVSSYYPKIILNQKLRSKHLGENYIIVYNSLYERRMAAKKAEQFSNSETLKIALNGGFGKTGNEYSILYAPQMMIQITITGQLCLLMLIEAMELAGIQCITANTDGVVMRCHYSKYDTMLAIVKAWEAQTNFETEETRYRGYYSRDVNNYLAIKINGKVKGKGAYLNPWHGSQDVKNLGIFRFHKNPMTTICIEAATQHIMNGTDIEAFIRQSTDIREFIAVKNVPDGAHKDGEFLGKVVRWYYAERTYGAINKVIGNHMVSESEGAKPLMDLPDSFPNDVNYAWYVDHTKRILEDIAFTKRQATLF